MSWTIVRDKCKDYHHSKWAHYGWALLKDGVCVAHAASTDLLKYPNHWEEIMAALRMPIPDPFPKEPPDNWWSCHHEDCGGANGCAPDCPADRYLRLGVWEEEEAQNLPAESDV